MYNIEQTQSFKDWLKALTDPLAKISILKRIERATNGNFGDYKSIGEGVYESTLQRAKVTAFTTHKKARLFIYCFTVAIKAHNKTIFRTLKAYGKN